MKISCVFVLVNQQLFSRAGDAHHKILTLLKGHFAMNKKTFQDM